MLTLPALVSINLAHYWRTNLAVMAGVAVGTAVLGGALLVGDSVRGSLAELTRARLSTVVYAIIPPRFVRDDLGTAVFLPGSDVPMIRLSASLESLDKSRRVSRVQLLGVGDAFWRATATEPPADWGPDDIAVNTVLAEELGGAVGDELRLRVEKISDIPRETLFGRSRPDAVFESTVVEQRVRIRAVLSSDRGAGRFSLDASLGIPRTAVMQLPRLQRVLGRPGQANHILAADTGAGLTNTPIELAKYRVELAAAVTPADVGVKLRANLDRGYVSVESPQLVLDPVAAAAAERTAEVLGLRAVPVLTHLANLMRRQDGLGHAVPYSTITAADPTALGLRLIDGQPAPKLADDEILISEWAAARQDLDLAAAPEGTEIAVTYFVEGERGQLSEHTSVFRLRGVVALDAISGDRGFAPEYPGISDKATLGDWDAPFPLDMKRIRNRDDQYWRKHKAAPKAFVSLAAGQRLFTGRFGQLTAVRLYPSRGTVSAAVDAIRAELPRQLPPEKTGLAIRPVLAEGLAASAGATDFAGLFIAFSFFLIVSAAILTGLMFRLGLDQRLRELGVLSAVGFTPVRIRSMLLAEGLILAALGGLVGALAAVGYAGLMLLGLRTLWVDAVGTNQLRLHVEPESLIAAVLAGPLVALLAVWLSIRGIRHVGPRALLGGTEVVYSVGPTTRASPLLWVITGLAAAGAVGLTAASLRLAGAEQAGAFFGAGTMLLTAAVVGFRAGLTTAGPAGVAHRSLWALAVRNLARRPVRSVLTMGLTAAATFLTVAVAANRHDAVGDVYRQDSGAGGCALLIETDIPIVVDLNDPELRRKALNITDEENRLLEGVRIYPFRLRPGSDASCRNLYRPDEPRVLGVPPELVARGGFRFARQHPPVQDRPWDRLALPADPADQGAVAAFADANTVQWILHKTLGDVVPVRTDDGREVPLQLVGTLAGSVFQSELLVRESDFVRLFPTRAGHRVFLVETPPETTEAVTRLLSVRLAEFGAQTQSTAERLRAYAEIENTYLTTFQQLGGLGLLLGTLGLGAVMMRSVLERCGELALLRALGFRRWTLAGLVLREAGLLLGLGLTVGATAALLAAGPAMLEGGRLVPWAALAATLGAVSAAGLLSGAVAAFAVLRIPLLPALRSE